MKQRDVLMTRYRVNLQVILSNSLQAKSIINTKSLNCDRNKKKHLVPKFSTVRACVQIVYFDRARCLLGWNNSSRTPSSRLRTRLTSTNAILSGYSVESVYYVALLVPKQPCSLGRFKSYFFTVCNNTVNCELKDLMFKFHQNTCLCKLLRDCFLYEVITNSVIIQSLQFIVVGLKQSIQRYLFQSCRTTKYLSVALLSFILNPI